MGKIRIGISGWTFPAWRGIFYPKGLPQKKELEFATRELTSLEINGTFYSLQKPETFENWREQAPENFQYAIKAPQFITHVLRLKEVAEPLATFFASGILKLQDKLGPILWQFPPNVMLKDDRFEKFLKLLPTDHDEAAKLAKRHGPKVKGRAWTKALTSAPIRHAFEFRHPSFLHRDFTDLLSKHNVAFVYGHASVKSQFTEVPTSDFHYARLHGEGPQFKKGYPSRSIQEWTKKSKSWSKDGDVFVYFSNDAKVYSPQGAQALLQSLSKSPKKAA